MTTSDGMEKIPRIKNHSCVDDEKSGDERRGERRESFGQFEFP